VRWIRVSYPDRYSTRPAQLADYCGWRTRTRNGFLEVCPIEVYEQRPPSLLHSSRLATPATAGTPAAYRHVDRWPRQDDLARNLRPLAEAELQRLAQRQSSVASWAAFQLDTVVTPGQDLEQHLQDWYQRMAAELPHSSLWAIDINRWFASRQAVIRGLFAAAELPELLARPAQEFPGLPAANGLRGSMARDIASTVNLALAATSPWLLGITATRVGAGLIVVLFGHPAAGRDGFASELIQLYRPQLLSSAELDVRPRPTVTASQIEALLHWWIGQLNKLFGVVLDPANYPNHDNSYNAQAHYGSLLSLDRLLACVLEVLIHARRDEFARKVLLFDCLDLLEGFQRGTYEQLCNPRTVREQLDQLTTLVPAEVGQLLLPRCHDAVEALEQLQDGFYVHERLGPVGLQIRNKGGQLQTIPLPVAVARYLRVVRDATHAFHEMAQRRPDRISLLAAHDGELPPALSDLAFLHFVRLLADPAKLLPGALRQQRYGANA
jgi:hypothetical protein